MVHKFTFGFGFWRICGVRLSERSAHAAFEMLVSRCSWHSFCSTFCGKVMKKLKKMVVATHTTETKMDAFAAPAKKIVEKGPLQGKLVRIVDEKSHLCGHLMDVKSHQGSKLVGQPVFKTYLKDFIPSAEKAPHQIACDEKDVIDLAEVTKPEAKPVKPLKFKDEERAAMEMRFDPDELAEFSTFDKDPRFAAIHMNMYYYLLSRDFELEKDTAFCWVQSEEIAQICQELDQELGGESFVQVVGRFAAKLKDCRYVFIPVWGGSFGGGDQHWTWLYVEKEKDGKWVAEYRDSLQSLHKDCWHNAEKLLTVIAVAVNDYGLKMPKDRANTKMQPKGVGLCGQFVCHWTETKIREISGEGPCNIGHPNIARINTRIQKMQSIIVSNKGFAKIHEAKLAKIQSKLNEEKAKEAAALTKIAEDKAFLEKAKISAGLKILIPWATLAGCAKCRWKVEGSTCCNPEKMEAKNRAVKVWQAQHKSKDAKFDKEVYQDKLKEVYQEIKAKHIAPLALPKVPEKAGGDLDGLLGQDST